MSKKMFLTFKKVPHYWKNSETAFVQPVITANGTAGGDTFATYGIDAQNSGHYKLYDNTTSWEAYYNLDSNVMYNPVAIKMASLDYTNDAAYYPTTGTIYGSNDGTTWDTLATFSNSNKTAGATWNIPINSTVFYKYHRIEVAGTVRIRELDWIGNIPIAIAGSSEDYDFITYTYEPYLNVVQPPYVPVAETVVTLSTPGSGTYTIPANVTRIKIKVTGAGGGGSGWGGSAFYEHTFNGSDGGRGALAEAYLDVIPGQQIPYVIGAGGIKSANVFTDESYYFAVAKAANGSTSSFNTSITAQGGEGAYGPYWANGGDNADYGGIGAPGASYGLGGYGGEGGTYNTISATNGANGSIEITYGGELQRPREEVYAFGTKSKDYYKWVAWTQPVLTSDNDSSGVVVSASSMGTGENPYKVMDGVKSGTLTGASSNYWGALTGDAWWKVKFPYKIKITGLTHYNRYEGTQATYRGVIGRFYADQALTIPIGDQIDTPDTNWYATSIANIPAEGIVTDTIIFKKNDTVLYSGIGELVITAMKAELSTESDYDFYEY